MDKKLFSKLIRNGLFFIILLILTFYVILKEQNIFELINIIKNVDVKFILLGIIVMFIFFIIESYNVKRILNSLNENVSLLKMIKFTLICFFFNGITPASSGGQPVEIYYMKKEKIKTSNSVLALLIQACSFLISTVIVGIICGIINYKLFNTKLLILFIIGLSIGTIALTIMLLCIFSPKLVKLLVNKFVKFISFVSFNKINLNEKNIDETINNYSKSSNYIKNHFNLFIRTIFRTTIQTIIYYSIPFCIYKSFGLNDYNIINIISLQAIIYSTTSCLPLPGAIGISEIVYLRIFKNVFGEYYLSSAMILSRSISFYWFIMIGFIVTIVNSIYLKIKYSN